MKHSKLAMALSALFCIPALTSCVHQQQQTMGIQVRPIMETRDSIGQADRYCQLGKYYYGQMRWPQAEEAYRKALAADPANAEASNGLGVVLAMQGKYDEAIAELKHASQQDPRSLYILNNLGFTYFLSGNYADAVLYYRQALALAPGNAEISGRLQQAMAQLPPSATNVAQPAPAVAPNATVAPAATATPSPASPAPAAIAGESPTPEAPASSRREVSGVIATTPAASPVVVLPSAAATPRVEIANGNGMDRMARRVGNYLQGEDVDVVHLVNQKPFNVAYTEIQYRSGYQGHANALKERLPLPQTPHLSVNNKLRKDVTVRLVLGKDMLAYAAHFKALNMAANK